MPREDYEEAITEYVGPLGTNDPKLINLEESSHWKRREEQYKGKRLAAAYEFPRIITGIDSPPRKQGETAEQMPYYPNLTPFEKKLYEVLPGFTQSTVGQALAKLSEGWVGKALGYIDVLAEGAERTSSLAVQFWNAETPAEKDELTRNLTSAWYAGGLGADMTNLPTFNYDDEGRVAGIGIPDDLPGAAGLTQARHDIQALVESGVSHSEALQQVKSTYYDDVGALQIRAQLYDTYFHVLADPLNYVLPYLKPVESIKKLSYFAGATKWADETIALGRKAIDVASDVGKAGSELDEVVKIGLKTKLLKGNRLLKFNEAAEAGDVAKVTKTVGRLLDDIGLTTRERIALNITGGKDPFKLPETTWEKFYDKMPWRLTPESRAYEYVTVIQDNIGKYVVEALPTTDDGVIAIYDTIRRAAAGAVGPELGHAFLTIEGRAVQAAIKGYEATVAGLVGDFMKLKNERGLLKLIGKTAGKSEEELMGLMKVGDFAAVAKHTDMGIEQLKTMFKMLDGKPYSPKMFKFEVMNGLADWTAKQGALMFGVKQRGFIQKLAQAVKSAETLAFLRINPGYMIRNVLNNEITLIARGAGISFDDLKKAGDYFDLDMEPFRFGQGFGAAGDIYAKPADVAGGAISDVMKGKRGMFDRFTEWVSEKKPFGRFDMGAISSKMESSASKRAFTTSYIRAYQSQWRPDVGFDSLSTYLPTRIKSSINDWRDDFIRAVDNKMADARVPADVKNVYSDNLNIGINNIMDEATAELGYDVAKSMPPEYIATIRDGLEEAAQKGTVREYVNGLRNKLTDDIEEAMPKIMKQVRDDVAVKVTAQGPAAFPKILADAQDEMTSLGIYHARRTEEISEIIRAMPDKKLAHEMWIRYQDDANAYYTRAFARIDATMQGFRKGVVQDKDLARFADDALENFKALKNGWKDFWKSKRTRGNAYWEADIKGRPLAQTWDDVAEQTAVEFKQMTALEDTLQKNIDNAVAMAIPDEKARELYLAGQFQLAELRRADQTEVAALFDNMKNLTPFEREQLWKVAVKERIERFDKIREAQFISTSAMEGDPKAVRRLEQIVADMPEGGIPMMITNKMRQDLLDAGVTAEDIAKMTPAEAWENLEALGKAPTISKTYQSGSYENATKGASSVPDELVTDEWWLTRGHAGLDAIERSTLSQVDKPAMMFSDLPKDAQKYLDSYITHVTGQLGDVRYASTRFAEFGRDAALLNYNRRYNYNTWLGTIMPFEFWTTHSFMKWALHSIDRPAMLTTYLRMQKMMMASGAPGQALPARLKGSYRIPFPWLPDWAGDHIFFDPLRSVLPFENFTYGYENEMQRRTQLEGKTMFILNDMAEGNEITQAAADEAIGAQSGPLWERAQQMALDDNEDMRFNSWDFASMLSAPHAPLDWAVKTMQGRPEDIGPFTPASRTIKGVMGLLGVDWNRHPMNIEGRVRTAIGLPAFDQWDDYRADRMLSNMAATLEYPVDTILRAMNERTGPAYDEAIKKSDYEFGIGAVGSTLGLPAKAYPEGEFLQRSLRDDYQAAWKKHNDGDMDAVNVFNELHPEYEARLALYKPPEERLKRFLVDNIWDIWHDLPKLTKDELKDQLGENFVKKFYDRDTRSYESITLDEMQIWLKLMGGDPPGTLNSEPAPIDLADPEVAWRVQVYYDTRNAYFPDELWEIQDKYYDIPEDDWKAKKAYREQNPMMTSYWDWRRDWMHRNPETVPYLTEGDYEFEYSSPEAERRAEQPQPWLTWDEWTQYLGPNMGALMEDHFQRDDVILPTMRENIENLAAQLGLSYDEALSLMGESLSAR